MNLLLFLISTDEYLNWNLYRKCCTFWSTEPNSNSHSGSFNSVLWEEDTAFALTLSPPLSALQLRTLAGRNGTLKPGTLHKYLQQGLNYVWSVPSSITCPKGKQAKRIIKPKKCREQTSPHCAKCVLQVKCFCRTLLRGFNSHDKCWINSLFEGYGFGEGSWFQNSPWAKV